MNDIVIKRFFDLQDKKYQEFHSKLCPNIDNIIGVRLPELRKIAKEIAKTDWQTFIKNVKNEYYEETMVEGLVIGYAKMDIDKKLEYIKAFVPKIDNWAVCDCVCGNFKFKPNDKEVVWKFLETYFSSTKEFEVRFVLVMFLDYFLEDKYIKQVLELIDKLSKTSYYSQMAAAWTISVAYVKYPNETMEYLENNNLDNFTYNKALQKIIESYRVDKDTKTKIRSMKR